MTGVHLNAMFDEFYHSIKTLEADHLKTFEDDLKRHEENDFLRKPNSSKLLLQEHSLSEPLPVYPGSTQAASTLCRKRILPTSNTWTIEKS
mmetsp:Transcript_33269/g.40835  ORF Transcript_33269/g.40835 Transcript_33269/m.40835 type:complete len:91 (+) Transcript_33269:51-323(+)